MTHHRSSHQGPSTQNQTERHTRMTHQRPPILKQLPEPADGLCYAWCPTMDLLAITVTDGKRVLVLRMNGVLVWDIQLKQGMAKHVVWRPDGKQLAIVTTKDQTLVYDTNTARLLSTLPSKQMDMASFAHWIVSEAPPKENKFTALLDQDILKSMPKLPPLPASSNITQQTFTTRQAIDGMIQNEKHGVMDLLLLFGDKNVNVTLHGLFLLGAVDVAPNDDDNDEEIVNTATRSVEEHYILTTSFTTMQHTLRRFNTQFVQNYHFLQGITLASSKVIALLGYIEEILTYSTQAIKAYIEFNSKFVGILKDELTTKGENVTDELYTLLLTGMMNEEVKDWMQNTVGDRGVKRWTKVGETAFDNTRRTILYHLVPACERLVILLTNLGALAKGSIDVKATFELKFIENSIESVKKLLKLLFEFVFKINKEQELFNSFIIWIQSVLADLQDEEPKQQHSTSQVSLFINDHLERSTLVMLIPFFRRNYNEIKIHTHDMFDSIKQQIKTWITTDEFSIPLGRIAEKQSMKFIGEWLYIITHYDDTVEIHRVDTTTRETRRTTIKFRNEVDDLKLTSAGDLFIVSDSVVWGINVVPISGEAYTQDQLGFYELKRLSEGKVKYFAVNGERNIGCAIDAGLQKYDVFFLSEDGMK